MMNVIMMVVYIVAAVAGSTLIKYGSEAGNFKSLFVVPLVNMSISFITLLGIAAYGLSFLLYIILLTRLELSFVSPLLIAFVYVLLMVTAFVVFKESFTFYKILGCSLILIGIVFILMKK